MLTGETTMNKSVDTSIYAWCYRCRCRTLPYLINRKYYCEFCNKEVKKLFNDRLRNRLLFNMFKPSK